MGRIIAVSNQKGGVGKTTSCVNLGCCLSVLGKKTLLVDFDPQSNSTSGFGLARSDREKTVYEMLIGEADIKDCLLETEIPNLLILPSKVSLSGAEIELINTPSRNSILKNKLNEILADFDYILIDCPPSLGLLTLNALVAADAILIPVQCEYYALEGISQLLYTINLVRERYNPELQIEGVLHTMFDVRNKISQEVVNEIRNYLGEHVFQSVIPRNVRLSEAPSFGKPVFLYDRNSKGSVAYMDFARELITKHEGVLA